MAKLAIEGLCRHFGDVEALRDIDVEDHEGEFVSILGRQRVRQEHAPADRSTG